MRNRDVLALAGYDMAGDDDELSGYDMAGDDDELGFNPMALAIPGAAGMALLRKLRGKKRPALSPQQQKLANFLGAAKAAERGFPAARGGVERRELDVGGLPSSFTFGPATAQTIDIVIDPWVDMRPVRLVVETSIVGAPGCLVQLKSANIGPTNQLGNSNPIGIGRYAPLAPGNRVQWGIIVPKIGVVLTFITTGVPAAATSITIEATLGCVSVG